MRRAPAWPMLLAMESTRVHISLELDLEGDTLSGQASDGAGSERDFLGWLGLVAAIDALLPRHATQRLGASCPESE